MQEAFSPIPANMPSYVKPVESQALRYVAGYLVKKIGKQPCNCKNLFLKNDSSSEESELFLRTKEYVKGRQHLKYVSKEFLDKLKSALGLIRYILNRDLHKKNLVEHIRKMLMEKFSFTLCFHDDIIKSQVFKYFIKVQLFNYTTQLNRIVRGLDLRPIPNNAPKFFLSAKSMYQTTKHKKK